MVYAQDDSRFSSGGFVLSLDLELMWGVYGTHSIDSYGPNILGVREAVPALLDLFDTNGLHATWATVGMLMFDNRDELLAALPHRRAQFRNQRDNNYAFIDTVGEDEASDPYHFGLSIVQDIAARSTQELGTHTFSHYYCLEEPLDIPAFTADIDAAIAAFQRLGMRPRSIVFPRNQVTPGALDVCATHGIDVYRGPGPFRVDRPAARAQQSKAQRGLRLANSYVPLCGSAVVDASWRDGIGNVPASRFLRPYVGGPTAGARLQLGLIKREMQQAAQQNRIFHLWFHPHNFGTYTKENISVLSEIVAFSGELRDTFGWPSLTMSEAADAAKKASAQLYGAA
ncbi:polysaccharide deacetylase family protein [uncultured Roseobacter sp.]|uniref:polysaccharide deacetylase family protein n=1 Tax=uncultured Roseobacter sp. TaxID=114847 RepID=UPI00262F275C|nr:polysaccharide deacetylase family protein [uncultured Roseobacter sp.]